MRKLGISLYPEKSTVSEMKDYIDKAHKVGCTRIFSCLLSVNKSVEEIKKEFIEINTYAHQKRFEIVVDVSPKVFDTLGINYQDLSFFKDIGADGIRLDAGFTGSEESLMTFNPYNLKIEINMSNDTRYIDTIMDYCPNRYQLMGCHNFYPHAYAGLGLDYFISCTENFKKHGIHTAAFVSTQNPKAFGPWPTKEGLPTLEMHRYLPLDVQIKHMIGLDIIDDIIISNCYPTEEELQKLSHLRLDLVTFNVELIDNLPDVEKKIVLEELHFNRGDKNEHLIRSTQSRVKYKGYHFEIFNTPEYIMPGDIVIESSEYGHYAGELQIAKSKMKNSGKSNVVGHIVQEELFLIEYIKPWQKFMFQEVK